MNSIWFILVKTQHTSLKIAKRGTIHKQFLSREVLQGLGGVLRCLMLC